MLKELFQGTADLAEVDWRNDPTWRQAHAEEAAAAAAVHDLKLKADALWASAQMGSQIARLPSPGDRCWAARESWLESDRRWEDAKRAKTQAEADAKQKVQRVGEQAGRDKWAEAEAEVFPQLIQWCREYEALRAQALERTGALLPELACAVCLSESDLSTFVENARRSFGS